jgi:hypothetical protein
MKTIEDFGKWTMRNVSTTLGREGYGLLAEILFEGRLAATVRDYADGSEMQVDWEDVDLADQFAHFAERWTKESGDEDRRRAMYYQLWSECGEDPEQFDFSVYDDPTEALVEALAAAFGKKAVA